jgi:hypothetical protein
VEKVAEEPLEAPVEKKHHSHGEGAAHTH